MVGHQTLRDNAMDTLKFQSQSVAKPYFIFALILFAETAFIISYIFESVWANVEIVNNKNKMEILFIKINFRELKYKRKRKVFCIKLYSFAY